MPVGDLISAADYNAIRNTISSVMGTGTVSRGYGQAINANTAVSTGAQVTKAQWDLLRFDIFNALLHQTGSSPSIVTASVGDVIRFGITHPNTQYVSLAGTADINRFNLGSGQFVTEALGSTATGDITWASQFYVDITYTFSSADVARFFFNSGGQLRITSSFLPSVSTSQTASWASLLAAAGIQVFGAQLPLTGLGSPLNGTNFYRLTSTLQTYHTSTSSGPYSSNTYRLQARANVADNSAGTANQVFVRVLLVDPYSDPGPPAPGDVVSGTITITTNMVRASGVLQPAPTAGNFITSGPSTTAFSAPVFS